MSLNVPRKKITIISGGRDDDSRGAGGGGGKRDDADWRDQLIITKSGETKSTAHNLMLILQHDAELSGLFWLDEFNNRVGMLRDPPWSGATRDEFSESDATELAAWLGSPRRYSMPARAESVMQAVEALARRAKAHPVRTYLRGLRWDGIPRVERMFVEMFGAEDVQYELEAAKCFMVSAVARILWIDHLVPHNGAQVDFMLILEGAQGKGKTSAVRELFGHQWYCETMQSPASTDFYQALRGRWGVEIGEMDSFSKADVTKVKQAITSRFDHYRPSYGRYAKSFRRECVFVGTTNEDQYLKDVSGGRRFLPVRVNGLRIELIRKWRDQLWAEAVSLFDEGFNYWILPASAGDEQDARFVEDSWTEPVQQWLDRRLEDKYYPPRIAASAEAVIQWTTTTELMKYALYMDTGKHSPQDQARVGRIMRRLGWSFKRVRKVDLDEKKTRPRHWVRASAHGDGDAPPF